MEKEEPYEYHVLEQVDPQDIVRCLLNPSNEKLLHIKVAPIIKGGKLGQTFDLTFKPTALLQSNEAGKMRTTGYVLAVGNHPAAAEFTQERVHDGFGLITTCPPEAEECGEEDDGRLFNNVRRAWKLFTK